MFTTISTRFLDVIQEQETHQTVDVLYPCSVIPKKATINALVSLELDPATADSDFPLILWVARGDGKPTMTARDELTLPLLDGAGITRIRVSRGISETRDWSNNVAVYMGLLFIQPMRR